MLAILSSSFFLILLYVNRFTSFLLLLTGNAEQEKEGISKDKEYKPSY